MYCEILCGAVLMSLSVVLACLILWMHVLFTHPSISIAHKIQFLHLKSGFIIFMSGEGLAALCLVLAFLCIESKFVFSPQNGNLVRFPYKSYSEAITVVVVTLLRDVLEQEKGWF